MEKKQIVDSILEAVREELNEFVRIEGEIESSVEYEERVLAICRRFGQQIFDDAAGEVSATLVFFKHDVDLNTDMNIFSRLTIHSTSFCYSIMALRTRN